MIRKKQDLVKMPRRGPVGEKLSSIGQILVPRNGCCIYICMPIEIVHYFMLFFKRPAFGRIYAFEVDGYGNRTGLLNSITVE